MAPLELLEEVFPLIVDQARYIELALRQRDLVERMAALRGHDGEDDPALKARMRDLEQQQRQIREDLRALLGDIEDHARRLPEKPELESLRETALKFAEEVRGSGAAEAMGEAEAALAEFAGTRAADKAKQAADILEKFITKCRGMGGMAGGCLVFQPSLSECLGDSVDQLLAEMGLSSGSGSGSGAGAGGGYSMRRGGMRNMGLYGSVFGMGEAAGSAGTGEGPAPDTRGQSAAIRGNPDRDTRKDAVQGGAAGMSEGAIPVRYRRQVGHYFQRIAEEVGDR